MEPLPPTWTWRTASATWREHSQSPRGFKEGKVLKGKSHLYLLKDSPEADLCIHIGVEIVNLLHLLHVSQRERILKEGTGEWTEVDCRELMWSVVTSCSSSDRNSMTWWDDRVFTSDRLKLFRSWSLAWTGTEDGALSLNIKSLKSPHQIQVSPGATSDWERCRCQPSWYRIWNNSQSGQRNQIVFRNQRPDGSLSTYWGLTGGIPGVNIQAFQSTLFRMSTWDTKTHLKAPSWPLNPPIYHIWNFCLITL